MWVPPKKKIKQTTKEMKTKRKAESVSEGENLKKKNFSIRFFLRFTEIGPPDFVGINTESALRDEGYA